MGRDHRQAARGWRVVALPKPAVVGVLLGVLLVLSLGSIGPVAAQGIAGWPAYPKLRSGDQVTISAQEIVRHDLYVAGGRVRHNGRIEGDLVVAGGQIDINGVVTGDLLVAGGTVQLSGAVGGDVRIAGGQATVTGLVNEDLAFAGGTLTVAPPAQVGGDVLFGAGQVTVDGAVGGNVAGSAGTYARGGRIMGQEMVRVGDVGRPVAARPTAVDRVLNSVRWFAGIVLFGGLLMWLAPWLLRPSAAALRARPLPSLGVGLLGVAGFIALLIAIVLVTVVVAILFGVFTLGGLVAVTIFTGIITAAAVSLLFAVIVAFIAHAVVGLVLGQLVFGAFDSARPLSRWQAFGALALGVLIIVVLAAIPVLGPLLAILSALFGLGALVLFFWDRWRERRAMAPSEPLRAPAAPVAPVAEPDVPVRPAA
jgi:hypothetical protein